MTPLEALAKLEADYEASHRARWRGSVGMHHHRLILDSNDVQIVGSTFEEDQAHIVSMHNSAKALFAVVRAAAEYQMLIMAPVEAPGEIVEMVAINMFEALAALGETVS